MHAKNLRIGNWLKIFDIYTQVEGLSDPEVWDDLIQNSNFSERPISEFEPIQIIEEWLIAFNFTNHGNDIFSIPIHESGLKKLVLFRSDKRAKKWNIGFADYYTGKEIAETMPTEVEYVHELQNLFFALSGSDLKLNPDSLSRLGKILNTNYPLLNTINKDPFPEYNPTIELDLPMDMISDIANNLRSAVEDALMEGLKRKGFEFENKLDLEQFIKDRGHCEDHEDQKERIYYVDNIPFFLWKYDYEISEPIIKDGQIIISASGGSYSFL